MKKLGVLNILPGLFISLSTSLSLAQGEVPVNYETLSAAEKLSFLEAQQERTAYDNLPQWTGFEPLKLVGLALPFRGRDRVEYMGVTVDRKSDFMPNGRGKPIHTYGSVGSIRFVVQKNLGYTGIFASGDEYGLVRLSLAAKPSGNTSIPGMAVKFLVDGQSSRNLEVMYSLEGQQSYNFFANTFSNVIKAPTAGALKLLAPVFGSVTGSPFKLGLGHLSNVDDKGEAVAAGAAKYPDQIYFVPTKELVFATEPHEVRDDFSNIAVGTKLYNVFVSGKASEAPVYLGYIESTSRFISSAFGDQNLFFNHQRKEADRP